LKKKREKNTKNFDSMSPEEIKKIRTYGGDKEWRI